MQKLKLFRAQECGAVSTEWVAMTALVVGLATLISSLMQEGGLNLANNISDFMSNWAF